MDDVGTDAARFFFILRNFDSHLNFDLALAKKHTSDNPVFYIQYVHARISSIFKNATDKRVKFDLKKANVELLVEIEELRLLKHLRQFSKTIQSAAAQLEPHIMVDYLTALSAFFHQFYQSRQVIQENMELAQARLALVGAVQIVIRNGLTLLGVSAPTRM